MISGARQQAILRATEVLGSLELLAVRLGVSPLSLRAMLMGRVGVPQRIFFELVDIISMESPIDAGRRRGAERPSDKKPR
jgi:hypothetical protein